MVNRQESTDWVPLPVANFDAYFGGKTFSKKYLKAIPAEVMERTYTGMASAGIGSSGDICLNKSWILSFNNSF